jgi:long-chain acyl-CoA synthetase
MLLHDFLRQAARKNPNSTALITSARLPIPVLGKALGRLQNRVLYGELERLSDALAAALADLGLQKGDRVALVLPNVAAFPICFYAVLKAGGVVAATNPTYPAPKMQHQINDCDAKIVITLSLFYPMIKEIQPQTQVKHVIAANVKDYLPGLAKTLFGLAREKKDGHAIASMPPQDAWLSDLLARYDGKPAPHVTIEPDDTALLQYTGGTTGISKGAMLTHRIMATNMTQMATSWRKIDDPRFREADQNPHNVIFLGAIPMFHAAGLVAVMAQAISAGAPIVLVPNPRDLNDLIDVIDVFKPNAFVGVPALYNAINNHPRIKSGEVSLASLMVSSSGTAPLSPVTKRTYEEISGNTIAEGYGMSECVVTHANPLTRPSKIGSVGLPYPDNDVRIVSLDDGLSDMPVGDLGEIVICGPTVMRGYHKMPTETANMLRQHPDGRTWLHTGDIGYMDEEGFFYIVDRKKDMVLIGGFNVYPTNVEKAIMEHPAVLEAGVAGIEHPDKVGQEALKAWVVLKAGQQASEADLIAHCEKLLAPYEVPRRFTFVKEIPKTAVGKILRRELIQMEMASKKE